MTDKMIFQMLETMLQSENGDEKDRTTKSLLSHLGNSDLIIRLIIQLFAKSNANSDEDKMEVQYSGMKQNKLKMVDEHEIEFRNSNRSTLQMNSKVKKIYHELQELRYRNDLLAAALGCCNFCFVADPFCRNCTGQGQRGWEMPDPKLFKQFICPALAILQENER
jgi:hypothetical protein